MELVKQKEKEFHNKAFREEIRKNLDKYYQTTGSSRAFYQKFLLANSKNKNVLEYGCGPGSQAFLLARQATRVTGIDISEVAIVQATQQAKEERLKNAAFLVMDAENLNFANDTFDIICGSAILHHLNVDRAYAEIARTLKPDGVAVFWEGLGHNPLINLYRKLTPRLRTEDEHPLLMADLNKARSFFGKVETHFFHLFSLAAIPLHRFAVAGRMLNFGDGLDRLLFKYLPFTKKYAWITVMVLSQPKE